MLENKISNAGKWSFLSVLVSKIVAPLTQLILAHILTPEIFGVIATITMITSFADLFTDAGFQKYIIHANFKNALERDETINVAFWSNLAISILFWILIHIFRNSLSTAVGNSGLGNALSIAALSIPLTSFSSIQISIYNREMKFKELFYMKLGSLIIPIIITIPGALLLKNYWSMILGNLAMNLYYAVLFTVKSSWRPRFYYSFNRLKKMFSFCGYAMIEQLLGWANVNVGILLVGIYFSEYYLGLYKTGMSTVNQIIDMFTSTIAPVAMSLLSRLQNDNKAFINTYYSMQKIVGIVIIPIGIGIYVFQDFFTQLFLGSQWIEVAPFIGLWALVRSLNLLYGKFSVNVFSAKGVPIWGVISQLFSLFILVPVILLCAPLGFKPLYIVRSFIMILTILIQSFLLWKITNISSIKITQKVIPCYFSALIMSFFGYFSQYYNDSFFGNIASIIICIIIYFSILSIFPNYRRELLNFIKKKNISNLDD